MTNCTLWIEDCRSSMCGDWTAAESGRGPSCSVGYSAGYIRYCVGSLPKVSTPVFVTGRNKLPEERMRLQWSGFELGVKLAAEEKGMAGEFDDFDIGRVGGGAADAQAGAGEQRFVLAIEFVAMAVALADFCRAVGPGCQRTLLQNAAPRAQPHGPAHLFHAQQFAQLVDDAVLAGGVELARIGVLQAANVAGKLDAGGLHAQTNSKIRYLLFAGVAEGVQHALDTAHAEAAGDQDAVVSG